MVMPLTTMAVATKRRTSNPLPGCHSRNVGRTRLRIRAKMTTKTGRLLTMVETRDTGPLSIDQNASIAPSMAKVSLKTIIPKAEFRRVMLLSCLKVWGRNEIIRKTADRQNAKIQDKFQKEMYVRAYLPAMSEKARNRLEMKRERSGLLSRVFPPFEPCLIDIIIAPATTIIIASHFKGPILSPSNGIAIIATKMG